MSSRPVSPPPISRWPFWVGVAVLVTVAASILLYADRPFNAPVMVVTLVCACIGIALGILPEMLDSEKRLRLAEAAVRDAADAQLRRLTQTADQLTHVVSRGQSTEEQAGQALGTLEEVAEKMVAQSEELASALTRSGEREQAAHAEEIQRLTDERDQKLTALEIRLNATSVALSETQAVIKKSSTATSRAIETLATRLEEVAEELREALAARPAYPAVPPPAPAVEPEISAADTSLRPFETEHPRIDVSPSPPETAPEPEAGEAPVIEESPAESPAADEAPASVSASEPGIEPEGAVDSGATTDTPAGPAPDAAAADAHEPAPRHPRKPRTPRVVEKHVESPVVESSVREDTAAEPERAPAEDAPPARPIAPLELALEGMPEPRPVMRLNRREPAGSTSLVATAYIGIGNKLYLRGDGPGLSWESGVPMQFLAIGKWGWTTTEASVPVTCRVYRNDDTPMLEENVVIDPGSKAEITPKF